jgi:hypothetical protein
MSPRANASWIRLIAASRSLPKGPNGSPEAVVMCITLAFRSAIADERAFDLTQCAL